MDSSGGLFNLDNFAAFVETTFWTDAVLHPWFLAVGARDRLRRTQRIMRAALAGAGFRMTSFWVWHNYSDLIFNSHISRFRSLKPEA
jgi:hypothetical protein